MAPSQLLIRLPEVIIPMAIESVKNAQLAVMRCNLRCVGG